MNHGYSDLDHSLNPATFRLSGVMPKLLEHIVSFIPMSGIEKLDPLSKAGVVKRIH